MKIRCAFRRVRVASKAQRESDLPPRTVLLKAVVPEEQKAPEEKKFTPVILDKDNHDPAKQLPTQELVIRVVALAQTLCEKRFYPYQVELASRIVESVLEHDGEVITSLMSRQGGKSETLGAISAAIAIIFPKLAKQFPLDWKLNITDEKGVYRGYAFGIATGIYAPKLEQASIMFERVKKALETDTAKKTLAQLRMTQVVRNGNTVRLSNGSKILCESASEQAKIEGATYHLLLLEEAQDISDQKVRKSLHPMVAATMGTIVKIGTATTRKCDFYSSIQTNKRMELVSGKRNHFFFPHHVCSKYNSLYRKYIEQEAIRLGEDSDEFQTSYCGRWIFERGMFVTQDQLFDREIAQTEGIFSLLHEGILPRALRPFSIVAGIDWGSSSDSTVVTLLAVDWNNPLDSGYTYTPEGEYQYTFYKKHIINWLEFIGDNYETQFWEITRFLATYPNLVKIVTDSNTCGKPIYDRLVAHYANSGIRVEAFNFQPKIKSDGYKSLYGDICGKRLTFPASAPVLRDIRYRKFVNQMLDLRKEYRSGIMQVAHPEEKGAHDDFGDSAMMSSWGANIPAYGNQLDFMEKNPFYN